MNNLLGFIMFAQDPICISIDSGLFSSPSISIISHILDKGYQVCPVLALSATTKVYF